MTIKSFRDSINEAIRLEMRKDENVILMGEDVAGGAGTNGEQDAWGGPLGVTKGLLAEFGRNRIIDTPISGEGEIFISWNSVEYASTYRIFSNGSMIDEISSTISLSSLFIVSVTPDRYQYCLEYNNAWGAVCFN